MAELAAELDSTRDKLAEVKIMMIMNKMLKTLKRKKIKW